MAAAPRWRLASRSVVVTGASKGIGLAVCKLAASMGARVLMAARNEAELQAAAQQVGASAVVCACDLATDEGRRKLVAAAEEVFGGELHCLVNNAGTNVRRPIEEQTQDEYDAIVNLNQHAVYHLCRLFQPMLTRGAASRGDGDFGASVVTVGSAAGVGSTGSGSAYGATKAAVAQLCRILACEWAKFRIRVNCVAPWVTVTPLLEAALAKDPNSLAKAEARTPMRRAARPEEIADAVVFLLLDASSYITGQVLSVDGGLSANHFAGPTVE